MRRDWPFTGGGMECEVGRISRAFLRSFRLSLWRRLSCVVLEAEGELCRADRAPRAQQRLYPVPPAPVISSRGHQRTEEKHSALERMEGGTQHSRQKSKEREGKNN